MSHTFKNASNWLAVTGATGFLGRRLMAEFSQSAEISIRALTRKEPPLVVSGGNVEYIRGDIADRQALHALLEPGATLVNLAYSNAVAAEDAIEVTAQMVEACAEIGIKRLVHCSSVSVYGRVSGIVTENTKCAPQDEYGRIKLAVEQTLLDRTQGRFELIILRPSEVFGVGGKTLVSLINSLRLRNQAINYVRSSLFGGRRTHLVPVETVVDAIRFLCADTRKYSAETFIVSADYEPLNNFHDIEQLLMEELDLPQYSLPLLTIPRFILETILLAAGRSTTDCQVLYSPQKLKEWGFHNSYNLELTLRTFAKAYGDNRTRQGAVF